MLDEMFRALNKLPSCGAGAQHLREIGIAEDIAKKRLGVARHPTVTLRHRALGIHADELIRAVLFPNARQSRGRTREVMDE